MDNEPMAAGDQPLDAVLIERTKRERDSNPDIDLIDQVILKNGPRAYKVASYWVLRDRHSGEIHHHALKIETFTRSKSAGWQRQDAHSVTLSDQDSAEIEQLMLFLAGVRQAALPDAAGKYMVLALGEGRPSSASIRRLLDQLPAGAPASDAELHVVTDSEKAAIGRVLSLGGDRLWELIDELQPDLFESVAVARLHRTRSEVVHVFAEQLGRSEWAEEQWDDFFKQNKWIFGHGLAYQFLSEIHAQPFYGGKTLSGSGGQRGDYLMTTVARAKFTVLVEIKKPNSPLVTGNEYRQKVYELGSDLTGGVSQLQSNCRTWTIQGARQEDNSEQLQELGIYTYEPKGILVIGDTAQLDTGSKRATFEMFRRNLHNPEIITYDELLARARALVSAENDSLPSQFDVESRDDNLPF